MAWIEQRILSIAAALAMAAPSAAIAQVDPGLAGPLQVLAAKDQRVATIAFRLQTGGFNQCQRTTRLSGLIVQDASQYTDALRPTAATVFNLHDAPAVTGLVPGGPAAQAGVALGDALMSVNGQSLVAIPDITDRHGVSGRYEEIIRRLDAAFAAGPVTLGLRRGDAMLSLTLTGAPACASDVQLDLAEKRQAGADGQVVTVSQGVVDFAHSDDELAFVIGHELAHNALGHREFLDSTHTSRSGVFAGFGGNGARVRETERQADYFGLYLVAWAGYDIHAAADFWRRMGGADWLVSLFPDGTHPGNGERIRELERAAAEIDAKAAAHQPLLPDYAAFAGHR